MWSTCIALGLRLTLQHKAVPIHLCQGYPMSSWVAPTGPRRNRALVDGDASTPTEVWQSTCQWLFHDRSCVLLRGYAVNPGHRLLMSVIKGCLKEDSKELKKLVMMYWEVVKKYDAEGKLLPEMILVGIVWWNMMW